jgi:hypothetical protein
MTTNEANNTQPPVIMDTPRISSDVQLITSEDLVEIRDCGGTVIERKIVTRVCGAVWKEKLST